MILLALAALQDFPGASQPQVCVTPEGKVFVVYLHDGNIKVADADGGRAAVAIDAGGRAKGGKRRGPRIGADAQGNLVVTAPVCFDEAEFSKKYPTNELWIVRADPTGQTWSKPVQVNEESKKAPESLHWMAVAEDGTAHVAWLDMRDGGKQAVWYAAVKGDKVGKNQKLTGAVCECCAPGLGLDGKGNPYMVVREGEKADRGILLSFSTNAGKSWKKPVAVQDAGSNVDG